MFYVLIKNYTKYWELSLSNIIIIAVSVYFSQRCFKESWFLYDYVYPLCSANQAIAIYLFSEPYDNICITQYNIPSTVVSVENVKIVSMI